LRSYYSETVWLAWWACILLIASTMFPLSILLIQSYFDLPLWWNPAPASILLILILVFGLIFLNFTRLSIIVDSESIKVRYGVVRETIFFDEVLSCEPARADLGLYLGVGIRLGVDISLAFTTSFGSAVKILRRNGRSFVFSTNSPEKLCKIINEISEARALRSPLPSKIP